MKIAIVGAGRIGSTFAFQLARAGHEVTVVARGARLAQLRRDEAIVTAAGERAAVGVSAALDEAAAWDLVLVTVLAHQVDEVLPALAASAARTVMFMFNTFEPLGRLRDAVGAARVAFGFPAILATLDDGKLTSRIVTRGMVTPVTDAAWAKVFTDAGIPAVVEPDMESWLRTHAALVAPVMVAVVTAHARKAGVSWAEATDVARALEEGLRVVRELGNTLTPAPIAALSRLPTAAAAALVWTLSRIEALRKTGATGPAEPRALIDAIAAAAPGRTPALLAIRP
ncbi:2-dehydropantoate 2-reductase [Sorangium cellulosum]|uniref:2-dehydropantoate 2-reductase n=1 Tax=Sorangium cellulosum TaxID=56 RepID=A0A150T7G5_SORCE|nr:2-dehydropantoate 2-reductase [Sorangium cellulosum]